MTLADFLTDWLDLYIKPSHRAPRTKQMYRYCISLVPKKLGKKQLSELTALDLQRLIMRVAATRERAAQQLYTCLSMAMRVATKAGLCGNVMDPDLVTKPEHTARTAEVLNEDEAKAYISAAMKQREGILLLLMLCGLRRGEALGLRWDDVQGDFILVNHQRLRVNGKYQLAGLKSKHSRRCIALPALISEQLSAAPRDGSGYICNVTPEALRLAHLRTLGAAGISKAVTLHGLRHTFAFLACDSGCQMKQLQLALGHASMSLTADLYADHFGMTPNRATSLVFNRLFEGGCTLTLNQGV